jgi:hypothetical protein
VKTLSHNVASSTLRLSGIRIHNFSDDCIGNCKSNYHTINMTEILLKVALNTITPTICVLLKVVQRQILLYPNWFHFVKWFIGSRRFWCEFLNYNNPNLHNWYNSAERKKSLQSRKISWKMLVRCTRYNIMWSSLSVTCGRAVVSPVSCSNKTNLHDITEILLNGVKH